MTTRFSQYIPILYNEVGNGQRNWDNIPEAFLEPYTSAVIGGLKRKNWPRPEYLGLTYDDWKKEEAKRDITYECYLFLLKRINNLANRYKSEPNLDPMFHQIS